ncbi:MAG: radical SAM protein, partial [Deltaproteobacteria bacterium]|nr:radical SAM protein [Deltaproteobacteria bacterium]
MKAAGVTTGCKVNQAESAELTAKLIELGYAVGEPRGCDVVVLNACAVTARAESEAYRLLRRLRRDNPFALLAIAGCLAQLSPASLTAPGLADLALAAGPRDEALSFLTPVKGCPVPPPPKARTRALLKVQDGCSGGCAYCVVPLARGPSRSVPPQAALAAFKALLAQGVKEAVLTGVHLGHYGLDLGTDLRQFLALIHREAPKGLAFRLRLSSLEPMELPLAREAFGYGWLAPHAHAPLQSGSDAVLKRMGRPYGRDDYQRVVGQFVESLGPMALGTDVLVGFPGESEADFKKTYDLLEKLP